MRELGGRVTTKVTYTSSVVIDRLSQFQSINPALLRCRVAVVPVLTEQTIEGTSLIENG